MSTKKKLPVEEAVLFHPSPVGLLRISASDNAITTLSITTVGTGENHSNKLLTDCAQQLDEYFAGKRVVFDLPLQPAGTPFQLKVWEYLQKIPYGGTCSYKDLAEIAGYRGACRAVGNANGANPICLIIPCHRIIAHNGSPGGYAYGLEIKKQLLQLEINNRLETPGELF